MFQRDAGGRVGSTARSCHPNADSVVVRQTTLRRREGRVGASGLLLKNATVANEVRRLSRRELEVLVLAGRGPRNAAISHALYIPDRQTHIRPHSDQARSPRQNPARRSRSRTGIV
jgi:hypothetical protein